MVPLLVVLTVRGVGPNRFTWLIGSLAAGVLIKGGESYGSVAAVLGVVGPLLDSFTGVRNILYTTKLMYLNNY